MFIRIIIPVAPHPVAVFSMGCSSSGGETKNSRLDIKFTLHTFLELSNAVIILSYSIFAIFSKIFRL
jgi:hypothetical protein